MTRPMPAPPAVTSTRSPLADVSMAMDNTRNNNRHAHPRLDRAGGTPRHLAHRSRDPLAAADPDPALPDLRRRGEGERAGDLVLAVLLRRAGDGVSLRRFLPHREPLEDRGRDLGDD